MHELHNRRMRMVINAALRHYKWSNFDLVCIFTKRVGFDGNGGFGGTTELVMFHWHHSFDSTRLNYDVLQ